MSDSDWDSDEEETTISTNQPIAPVPLPPQPIPVAPVAQVPTGVLPVQESTSQTSSIPAPDTQNKPQNPENAPSSPVVKRTASSQAGEARVAELMGALRALNEDVSALPEIQAIVVRKMLSALYRGLNTQLELKGSEDPIKQQLDEALNARLPKLSDQYTKVNQPTDQPGSIGTTIKR